MGRHGPLAHRGSSGGSLAGERGGRGGDDFVRHSLVQSFCLSLFFFFLSYREQKREQRAELKLKSRKGMRPKVRLSSSCASFSVQCLLCGTGQEDGEEAQGGGQVGKVSIERNRRVKQAFLCLSHCLFVFFSVLPRSFGYDSMITFYQTELQEAGRGIERHSALSVPVAPSPQRGSPRMRCLSSCRPSP